MSHPNDSVSQLNKLLQQDASQVLTWLKDIWTGKQPTPENFNWLGLAKSAALHASYEKRKEDSLQWAEVAISIYEYLMKDADLAGRNSFVYSLMNLRAHMIIRYGAVSQDRVLDLKQVIELFFYDINMSYIEAATKAVVWKSLSIESIRELRRIKNRLSALKSLSDAGKLSLNQELKSWLDLRDKLP